MRCDVGTTIRPADSSQPIRVRRLATHARSLAECCGQFLKLGIPSPVEYPSFSMPAANLMTTNSRDDSSDGGSVPFPVVHRT